MKWIIQLSSSSDGQTLKSTPAEPHQGLEIGLTVIKAEVSHRISGEESWLLTLALEAARDVAFGVIAGWLYDVLKNLTNHDTVKIGKRTVTPIDEESIKEALKEQNDMRGVDQR